MYYQYNSVDTMVKEEEEYESVHSSDDSDE